MNRTTRKAIALVIATLTIGGATAAIAATNASSIFIPPGSINGRTHAITPKGAIKANGVGNRQLKKGIVSCPKLSYDLAAVLCTGKPGSAKAIAKGSDGAAGANGKAGASGAPGAAGANGENGGRGDGQTVVDASTPGVSFSNPSVNLTGDGVTFGPYADGGAEGGTVRVDIGPGHTLADLAHVTYTARFDATADNGDAPYFRVFIDNDQDGTVDHDVVFSPSTQPGACYGPSPIVGAGSQCASRGRMIEYHVDQGTVRYDDDPGSTPDVSWATVVNQHGTDKVMFLLVSSGFSLGATTGAVLNSLGYEVAGSPPATLSFAS